MDLEEAAVRFGILARNLKDAGETGLRRELWKAIGDSARPAVEAVRAGLPEHMPGRYAGVLDPDLQLSVIRMSSAANPGIRIRASNRGPARKLRRLEGGVLAHPLWGNRKHWYYQTDGVVKGFFTEPLTRQAPAVRDRIVEAIDRVEEQVMRSS